LSRAVKPGKCPDCGAKLGPEDEACPNCPWSYKPPEEEANPLKAQSGLRDVLLPVLFFGLLGYGVWRVGTGLLGVAQDPTLQETGSLSTGGAAVSKAAVDKNTADSMAMAKAILEGGSAGVGGSRDLQAELEGRAQPGGGASSAGGLPERKGGGSVVVAITKETAQSARPPREWRLRGRVYDLVTLKPIAGAMLVLTDNETNARAETMTNAEGRYRTVLPPLRERGYLVAIKKNGYAQSYAGPESAGVKDLDAGSRKELARQLGRSVEAPTVLEPGSDAPLVTDFFLAPLDVR
jgi:hypothetical protein